MKVHDILRVKGSTLYTAQPDESLVSAVNLMAERDIGSLVVMEHGDLVGMLTFREVIQTLVKNGGALGASTVPFVSPHVGASADWDCSTRLVTTFVVNVVR